MHRLRVLFSLLLVCFICLSGFGTAYAVSVPSLDDIDAKSDFEKLQDYDFEPARVPDYSDDYGISTLSFWDSGESLNVSLGRLDSTSTNTMALNYMNGTTTVDSTYVKSTSGRWIYTGDDTYLGYALIGSNLNEVSTTDRTPSVIWYKGSYVDVTESVDYDCVLTVSGTLYFSVNALLEIWYYDNSNDYYYDYDIVLNSITDSLSAYLLINGEPYGDALYCGDTFSYQIDYDSITSIGWRFVRDSSSLSVSQEVPLSTTVIADPPAGCEGDFENFDLILKMKDSRIDVVTEDPQTGFFNSILEWLSGIRDSIVNLPSVIADKISALFVPDERAFDEIQREYEYMLESKLGFVYQAYDNVIDLFNSILNAFSQPAYSFTFPGIKVPLNGEYYVIVQEQDISLDNGVMDVLRPVAGTIVAIICVLAFMNTAKNAIIAIVSGVSFFEFLKGGGRDAD